ncbi:membrane protein insertion efficiency factor YidD [Marinifilum fragile]|uniref:membrane protein insertion efficiency factor YidD n=1 Tax=Marinifilum fragile TaxID=570161 RepID=UPI001C48FCF6|nr:membrane protein insertion efficiency factor YidD [Marinifilum fragile]
MRETNKFENGGDKFELISDQLNSAIIQRHFTKHTQRDIEIHSLPIPVKPLWLNLVVRMLRMYQKYLSPKLGNKCVFDPSCSRYSEMAFRKYGFRKGILLTVNRLKRCRPENGGVDELV